MPKSNRSRPTSSTGSADAGRFSRTVSWSGKLVRARGGAHGVGCVGGSACYAESFDGAEAVTVGVVRSGIRAFVEFSRRGHRSPRDMGKFGLEDERAIRHSLSSSLQILRSEVGIELSSRNDEIQNGSPRTRRDGWSGSASIKQSVDHVRHITFAEIAIQCLAQHPRSCVVPPTHVRQRTRLNQAMPHIARAQRCRARPNWPLDVGSSAARLVTGRTGLPGRVQHRHLQGEAR